MTTLENTIPRMDLQRKNGRAWETIRTDTDKAYIYRALASELINKKINACTYIKSIHRTQMYSHVEITVTFDNGCRSIYYLEATSF